MKQLLGPEFEWFFFTLMNKISYNLFNHGLKGITFIKKIFIPK